MPLFKTDDCGTNSDGSRNEDYCRWCYKDGSFTEDWTMEEMIEFCAKSTAEMNRQAGTNYTPEEWKEQMRGYFPELKRWKGCNTQPKSLDERAAEMLERCDLVTLASIGEDGCPRPCVLAKIASKGYHDVWMATAADSVKVADFTRNPKAGLSYHDSGYGVTLTGEVEVVSDDNTRREMWQHWLINHFPEGPADPTYTLLHFTGRKAVIYIGKDFVHKDISNTK